MYERYKNAVKNEDQVSFRVLLAKDNGSGLQFLRAIPQFKCIHTHMVGFANRLLEKDKIELVGGRHKCMEFIQFPIVSSKQPSKPARAA